MEQKVYRVSAVIPIRNEEKFIERFLNSILEQDFPKKLIELIIVDGASSDNTKSIVSKYINKTSNIILLDNPLKTVPYALNIGIKKAKGDIIIRLDAHAEYPSNYISTLVSYLKKLNADNVGASVETIPANKKIKSKAIAVAMSTPFGVGNATFRINKNHTKEFIEVDTVPFGCYRRDVFDRIGLFDEELTRNQDNEFNERLKKAGGKIYLIPSLKIKYFARENYSKLFKMFYQYGYFGPLVDIKLGRPSRLRRYIPSLFVLSMVLPLILSIFYKNFIYISLSIAGIYFLVSLLFSIIESVKNKNIKLIPFIICAYFISHISYGIGYLKGFVDFVILKVNKKKKINVEISR
jgi:glycosyltransferase involved in cell wall biosynthesis